MKAKSITGLMMILVILLSTGYVAGQTKDGKRNKDAQAGKGSSDRRDTGRLWTIKTSDSVKPELRKLLEGKKVREGLNTILETPKGSQVLIKVRNGQIAEFILTNGKGARQTHVMARMAAPSEGGHTSADCIRTYDQCLDNCRAAGGLEEYICNLGCGWDLAMCVRTVGSGGVRSVYLQ